MQELLPTILIMVCISSIYTSVYLILHNNCNNDDKCLYKCKKQLRHYAKDM
jgi:uncharacterized protein YukE